MLLNRIGANTLPTIENFFEPKNGELEAKDRSGRYRMLLIRCSYRIMLSSVYYLKNVDFLGLNFRNL